LILSVHTPRARRPDAATKRVVERFAPLGPAKQ
jgi:hypothetical protein